MIEKQGNGVLELLHKAGTEMPAARVREKGRGPDRQGLLPADAGRVLISRASFLFPKKSVN